MKQRLTNSLHGCLGKPHLPASIFASHEAINAYDYAHWLLSKKSLGSLQSEIDPCINWANQGCAEVIGFEPLPEECEKLNLQARSKSTAIRYFPWALGDGIEHTLYITNAPMTSSLFSPARATVDLFLALGELMEVKRKVQIKTHRLDDIQKAMGADFLKLDVQGAELMILQNAAECLRSVSVLQCEVEFVDLYEGQPLMAEVDKFLRSQGFTFMRFAYIAGRPSKPLSYINNPAKPISQIPWGDAIYIKDFRRIKEWSSRQLRAGAFILHEAYEAYDMVSLILRELDQRDGGGLADCYTMSLLSTQSKISCDQ